MFGKTLPFLSFQLSTSIMPFSSNPLSKVKFFVHFKSFVHFNSIIVRAFDVNPLDQAKGYKSIISQISSKYLYPLSPKNLNLRLCLGILVLFLLPPNLLPPTVTPGARYLHRARLKISVWGQPTTPSTWSGPVPGPPVCARNRGIFRTAVRQPSQSCSILSLPATRARPNFMLC